MIALLTATLLALMSAQDPRPVFRVGSELVVIDLIAADRAGRAVADLEPAEIQVLEDGKPQQIQFLRLVGRGPDVRNSAGVTAPATPGATAATTVAERGESSSADVRVAIVLDLGSMPFEAFPRVRNAVLQLLGDELPAGIPVMIATVGRQVAIHQPFTTDRAALTAAVNGLPASLADHVTFDQVLGTSEQLCAAATPTRVGDSTIAAAKGLIDEANRRVSGVSWSLSMLARSLGSVSGRKHIVFYSAGYATNPANQMIEAVAAGVAACTGADIQVLRRHASQELGSAASSAATDGLRAVVDRANRAQVSFYAVDPRGLMTGSVQAQHRGASRTGGRGIMMKFAALSETLSQDYLRTLAADTGGRAFFNTNDIGAGLRRAWQDADSYYLIGYVPPQSRKPGRFRRISVKVTRPNLDVRYRQGYYEATEQELAEADIESALRAPAAFERDGFEVATAIEGNSLRITVQIAAEAIRFSQARPEHHADFSVHGELRDAKGALVGEKPLDGRDVALRLTPERLAEIRSAGNIGVRLEARLPPPGTYRLTIVARDSGGWIAARTIDVLVAQPLREK